MGIFNGANKTEMVGDNTPRLEEFDGNHQLKLVAIRTGNKNSTFYGADFVLLKSDNPTLVPGAKLSWAAVLNRLPAYFFSEIRRFLGALQDEKPEDIDEAKMDKSQEPDFIGLGCAINAFVSRSNKINEKTGKAYGKVVFSHPE